MAKATIPGKIVRILFAIGILVVGIAFVIASVFVLKAPKVERVETEATVVEINEDYDSINETTTYEVFVDYEVDGKQYTHAEYGSYTTGMKVGDKVTVEYNPEDPSDVQAPGADNIPYIILAVGAVAVILGIVLLVRAFIVG